MTLAITLPNVQVAPGNSVAAVPTLTGAFVAGDVVSFVFGFPPGLSTSWSGGTVGGPLGVTLSAASSMAPGAYTVPFTWVNATQAVTGNSTLTVTVTDQQYQYALAGPDKVARALSRLTSAFKNQPNCQNILKSLLVGFPEIENVFWQIINQRILSVLVPAVAAGTPTGNQIDIIGGLVGELRQGRVDASYLPAVIVRIRVNRSKGTAEDIIQVSTLLFPESTYSEAPVASWNVKMFGIVSVAISTVANLLGKAKATGTYGSLEYATWNPATNLLLDYTAGHPTGALVLDYTVANPVAGAGVLTGLAVCTPS
jgi:hypothetical protein